MKTIAVDEETWEAIKKLKSRLEARSYTEVLKRLIEAWHLMELDKKAENVVLDDEDVDMVISILRNKKEQ